MCARLANLCVRTFVQLYKHVCVYLYNVYMHVCVRLAKLMDQAEKILQLQVNSSCSARGIIAMQPRCVKTLIQTDFCVFLCQHISMSLSPPYHTSELQVLKLLYKLWFLFSFVTNIWYQCHYRHHIEDLQVCKSFIESFLPTNQYLYPLFHT